MNIPTPPPRPLIRGEINTVYPISWKRENISESSGDIHVSVIATNLILEYFRYDISNRKVDLRDLILISNTLTEIYTLLLDCNGNDK